MSYIKVISFRLHVSLICRTSRYNQRGDNEWSSDSESNFINDDVEYTTDTDSTSGSREEVKKKKTKKPKKGKVSA